MQNVGNIFVMYYS